MPRPPSGMNLSIAQLEQILDLRKTECQRLERKRHKLQKQLDQLDVRLSALGGAGGAGRGRVARNGRGARGGRGRVKNAKSLNEMIAGVLGKSSKPMNVGDIADAVKRGGYKSNSANFRSIVNQTLIKDDRFGAASRGMYQLKK